VWLPSEAQAEIEAEVALAHLARCAGSAPLDCILSTGSAARERQVAENRMPPLVLSATNALQLAIDQATWGNPALTASAKISTQRARLLSAQNLSERHLTSSRPFSAGYVVARVS
jgi:hypothetical protein